MVELETLRTEYEGVRAEQDLTEYDLPPPHLRDLGWLTEFFLDRFIFPSTAAEVKAMLLKARIATRAITNFMK